MKPIKCLSLLLLLVTLFSSCFTAKNLDKYITKQYPDFNQPSKKKPVEGISIASSMAGDDYASHSNQKSKIILPLIVYWQWDYTTTCVLNPAIPLKDFTNAVNATANKALKQKLNGRKLQLTLEQLPTSFSFYEKAHLVFVIYTFGWSTISVKSQEKDMIVSYKVTGEGTTEKTGKIQIPYGNDQQYISMYQSWKKATDDYLFNYQNNINRMSKLVVEELVKEM